MSYVQVTSLIVFGLFLLWIISYAIRSAHRRERYEEQQDDGPGTYTVVGVNRSTAQDETITVLAASRANAKVKGELQGLAVTAVEKTEEPEGEISRTDLEDGSRA